MCTQKSSRALPTANTTTKQSTMSGQMDSSPKLEDPAGPSVWEAAAQHKDNIPSSEWEYAMRKSLKDAAFTNLDYLPACTHMPVCAAGKCSAPRFVWVSTLALNHVSV
jgi:hypothetical protein